MSRPRPGICAIVAAGPGCKPAFVREAVEGAELIIALDGGAALLAEAGVCPHVVVGDLDSLDDAGRARVLSAGAELQLHPVEKDKTDAQLAVELAEARGYRRLVLLAASGGRIDHALANVFLLEACRRRGLQAALVDESGWAQVLVGGDRLEFTAPAGCNVSLLALSEKVEVVEVAGLHYPLQGAVVRRGDTLGVSNRGLGGRAAIAVGSGSLLVVAGAGAGLGPATSR